MPKDVSALKVHARFSQSSFYAGQEVVCQIAISHEGNRETPSYSRWRSQAPSLATSRAVSPQRSSLHDQPNISRQSSTRLPAVLERGHRPTLSLGGASVSPSSASSPGGRVRAHQRSTSIIPDRTSPGPSRQSPNGAPGRRGPGVGHGRSASMQVGSRRASNLSTPTIGAGN